MAGASKNKSSLFSPGQLITGFIFSNILFLILGIAIGKGDFSALPEPEIEPNTVKEVTLPEAEPNREIEEFRSLELASDSNQKKHIEIPTQEPKPRTVEPAPVPHKKTVVVPPPKKQTQPIVSEKQPTPQKTKKQNKKGPTYYLQLTASKQKAPIQRFFKRVKKKGYPAKMVHEGSYYKIQLGNYSSKDKAVRMKVDIDKALGIQSWIKQR